MNKIEYYNSVKKSSFTEILRINNMIEKTLAKDELIGLQVTIKECSDPSWINKSGIVLDETKKTFLIEIEGKQKRIGKKIAKFEFEHNGIKTVIDGSKIIFRPENRIKKVR